MELREEEHELMENIWDRMPYLKILADDGYAATWITDGRILMSAGVSVVWNGVAEVWVIPSKYVEKYPIAFNRAIREYLSSVMDTFNLHRLQTSSVADEKHARWMRWLGFKQEGIMRQYTTNKTDYYNWGRVR